MELAYFSGYFRLRQRATGGAGVILRFERVRPRDSRTFQPNRWREITPQFLDQTIRALKRWNFDLITMDEVCRRAVTLPKANRFACLTFDGGSKDVITQAYPVLSKHGVPFTVYLPTAFPDKIGQAWWLALEEIIAREERISLVIDRKERRFATGSAPDKYDSFEFLASWMRTLPPQDLSLAIHDLCTRYSVDMAAASREASMTTMRCGSALARSR
jgi:peptidoglycan/xylan/chitin deacetylase (PgdA/CDA1 family)